MDKLIHYIKFVLLAVFVGAFPGEIILQIFMNHSMSGFKNTIITYAVIASILYWLHKMVDRFGQHRLRQRVLFFFLFGIFGLMIEWFALGNAPWLNLNATQIGMFTFWASLYLIPTILLEEPLYKNIQRGLLKYYLSWASLCVILAALVPNPKGVPIAALFLFSYGIWVLNYFYFKYFRELKSNSLKN